MGCSSSHSQLPIVSSSAQPEPAAPLPPIHLSQRAPIQTVFNKVSNLESATKHNEAPSLNFHLHESSSHKSETEEDTERLTWRRTSPAERPHLREYPIGESKCCTPLTSGRAPPVSDAEQQSMDSRREEGLSAGITLPNCVPRLSLISDAEDESSEGERGRSSGHIAELGKQTEEHSILKTETVKGQEELKREDDGWDLRSMESTSTA